MYTDTFEQWAKFTKNNHPFTTWNKAFTEMTHRLTQQNLEMIGKNITRTSEQIKRLTTAKKPEDFWTMQREIVTENMGSVLESMQQWTRMMTDNIEECADLCKTNQETANTTSKTQEKSSR